MGMDVMHYEVKRILNPNEFNINVSEYNFYEIAGKNIRAIEMNEREIAWAKEAKFDTHYISAEKEFDWENWLNKNQQYKEYEYYDFQLTSKTEKHWIHLINPKNNEAILLEEGFIYKEKLYLIVEIREVGYMRKPFRHSEYPSKKEGDNIILTVTNFSDEGEEALTILKDIDKAQSEEANINIFKREDLIKLKNKSHDKEYFHEQFIENFKLNHFILINW